MISNSGIKIKLKSFLGVLLIFSISITVGLLIGEVIIRLMYKKEMVLFPRYHTDVKYGDLETISAMKDKLQNAGLSVTMESNS